MPTDQLLVWTLTCFSVDLPFIVHTGLVTLHTYRSCCCFRDSLCFCRISCISVKVFSSCFRDSNVFWDDSYLLKKRFIYKIAYTDLLWKNNINIQHLFQSAVSIYLLFCILHFFVLFKKKIKMLIGTQYRSVISE